MYRKAFLPTCQCVIPKLDDVFNSKNEARGELLKIYSSPPYKHALLGYKRPLMSVLPLVVFSHLRWHFVYQRPQHLLSRFAQDQSVFFLEEPVHDPHTVPHWERQHPCPHVTVLRPHTPCPAWGFDDAQLPYLTELIEWLVREEHLQRCLLWMYTPMALPLTDLFAPEVVIFDCMDELSAFDFAPPQLVERERQLLAWADVVFTGG